MSLRCKDCGLPFRFNKNQTHPICICDDAEQQQVGNVSLGNQVRLPSADNCIAIYWLDGFKNIKVWETPYFWDMVKAMEDEQLLVTKEKDGWILKITIEAERST